MKFISRTLLLLFIVTNTVSTAFAIDTNIKSNSDLLTLKHQWAKANYQLVDDEQEQAFEQLLAKIGSVVNKHPKQAENWIWLGIIQSSYAGAKGGLGALSLAKEAKSSLEKALEVNEQALSGSAYTSLGALYHKVPGWPIGFGDDDKAKELLKKAVTMNPSGIDANYFYGEYLFNEKKYSKAKDFLLKAQQAPARENRPLADNFRQKEITALIVKVNKKLNKKKKV